jgi:bacteriocin-like protein
MTTAINVAVTSKSTREVSRELTDKELAQVSGGTLANSAGGLNCGAGAHYNGLGSPEELQLRK